jgi:hypothetical protein
MGDLQGVSIGSLTGTLPTRAMIPNVPALVAGGTSGAGTVTLVLPDGWDAQMDERAKRVVQVERTRAARRLVEGGI